MAERNNGSAAYDFSRFEAKTAQRPAPKNNVIELPQKAARPKLNFGRVVKRLLGIAVVLAIAGTLIVNQLQVNELNVQLQKAQKELGEKQSEYIQLRMEAQAMASLNAVEEYATNVLGMQKIQPNQVEYVRLNNTDKIEVAGQNTNKNIFQQVWDFFAGILS